MIAPPPVSELNTVTALLAVIADPKRSAEALAGIKAASDEYRALVQAASDERAAAAKALDESTSALRANAVALETLAKERAEVNGKLAKNAEERKALDAGFASLDERLAELAEKEDAFEKRVAEREADIVVRSNELLVRETQASALIAEYEGKLAKLKTITG